MGRVETLLILCYIILIKIIRPSSLIAFHYFVDYKKFNELNIFLLQKPVINFFTILL